MKKRYKFLCALLSSCVTLIAMQQVVYASHGTGYIQNAYKGHGPDGELFLDPFLQSELKDLAGKSLLDVGCGTAPWAILAAQNGATVYGIDIQQAMLDKAQIAIAQAGVEKAIKLRQGDVVNLPYKEQKFDRALSVNVGCNLPGTMPAANDGDDPSTSLVKHFNELARVLKPGGSLLVSAPASFGVLFTDGKRQEKEVREHIDSVLAKIGSSEDAQTVITGLKELQEVNRATFVRRNDRLVLVTNEKQLVSGEAIWSKIPGAVVPNYYHSEEEYLIAFSKAGLFCVEIKRPCFFGNVKYKAYREQSDALGEAYKENHPFTLYYVTKKG